MAYGEKLRRLNPSPDALIFAALRRAAPEAETLLDVACGRGDRLRALAAEFPSLRLSGADADAEMAARADGACPAAEIAAADAAALPFAPASFDAVLCECSFSLFPDMAGAAREITRVLRPGGALLLGDLYARADADAALAVPANGTVRTVCGRGRLEALFAAAGLTAEAFADRSGDLAQLLGQMLFDGTLCDCLPAEALRRMKEWRTGYGLWTFRRPA